MNYQYINFVLHYQNEAMNKAKVYMGTNTIRCMCAGSNIFIKPFVYSTEHQKYGIPRGEALSINHIISVILYTDYTDLSSNFTSTFRKRESWELLGSVKQRNRRYAWMGRYLMETVQVYGDRGLSVCGGSRCGRRRYRRPARCSCFDEDSIFTPALHGGGLTGSFYTGMSSMLNLQEFAMILSSPTSTSVHIEVAEKFSGEAGIILEFSNRTEPAWLVYGFDVSFISRFKEEDERY